MSDIDVLVYIDGERMQVMGDVILKSGEYSACEAAFSVRGNDVRVGGKAEIFSSGRCVFSGVVFSVTRTGDTGECVAYDAIRYLQGRGAFSFSSVTASAVVRAVSAMYGIGIGYIEETGYRMESLQDDIGAIDIIKDAIEMTEDAGFGRFVLRCEGGKLTLLPFDKTVCGYVIGPETASEFSVTESMGNGKYNHATLVRDTDDGRRIFVAEDVEDIKKYGMLSYMRRLRSGEIGQLAASAVVRSSSGTGMTVRCVLPRTVPELFGGCGGIVKIGGDERVMRCVSCVNVYGQAPRCVAVFEKERIL